MNFTVNQAFTLTTDDQQQLTYTIAKVCDDGRLLVHSSLLERCYFISQEAFGDFLRVIGYKEILPGAKYKVWLINHRRYLHRRYLGTDGEWEFLEDAIDYGKLSNHAFEVHLGNMKCASWTWPETLQYTEEYKNWYQNQQLLLAKMEGSYP